MIFYDKNDRNGYLRGVISQIKEEGLNDDLFQMLCVELKFALLDNPYYGGASIHVQRDDRFYLLLFTNYEESTNDFPDGCGCHLSFGDFLERLTFPVYCYIGKDQRIHKTESFKVSDGILFSIGNDEFIVDGELLERLKKYFKTDLYSATELKSRFDRMDNSVLNEMIKHNPLDWDKIIRQIADSTMLFSIDMSNMEEYEEVDRVFNFIRLNPFGIDKEVSLHTAKEGIQYAVIVNFKGVVDHVFKFGLPELTISTPNGDVVMSRNLLIDKYELIKEYCDDKRLKLSYECVFIL